KNFYFFKDCKKILSGINIDKITYNGTYLDGTKNAGHEWLLGTSGAVIHVHVDRNNNDLSNSLNLMKMKSVGEEINILQCTGILPNYSLSCDDNGCLDELAKSAQVSNEGNLADDQETFQFLKKLLEKTNETAQLPTLTY
uniref:hypothetical protein n=1 Tax=Vibrio anguillarum TaxID=55601 RepID=UPI001BE49D68